MKYSLRGKSPLTKFSGLYNGFFQKTAKMSYIYSSQFSLRLISFAQDLREWLSDENGNLCKRCLYERGRLVRSILGKKMKEQIHDMMS